MTDLDRKILAKACGLCWHEWVMEDDYIHAHCKLCGKKGDYVDTEWPTLSFSTPDDWELVRVKVVVLHLDDYAGMSSMSLWSWLLNSPQDCCWDIAQWIKSRPDLFPWVVDFIAEIAEKKMPTGSAQIASGKGMPWVEEMMEGKG